MSDEKNSLHFLALNQKPFAQFSRFVVNLLLSIRRSNHFKMLFRSFILHDLPSILHLIFMFSLVPHTNIYTQFKQSTITSRAARAATTNHCNPYKNNNIVGQTTEHQERTLQSTSGLARTAEIKKLKYHTFRRNSGCQADYKSSKRN